MSVMLFKPLDEEYLENPDLSGPFILGLLLGLLVLLVSLYHTYTNVIIHRPANCISTISTDSEFVDGYLFT